MLPLQVFRRIVALWVGLGMRESFAEWKIWTKKRIKQRRKDARKVCGYLPPAYNKRTVHLLWWLGGNSTFVLEFERMLLI